MEIGVTDTECSEELVVGNERRGHEKVAFEVLDVVQRRLLLVLVRLPSLTLTGAEVDQNVPGTLSPCVRLMRVLPLRFRLYNDQS